LGGGKKCREVDMLSNAKSGKGQVGIERFDLRVALVAVTLAFYVLTFLPLYDVLGAGILSLSSVPVALTGWLFGLRPGLIAGALAFPMNAGLLGVQDAGDVQGFVWGGVVSGTAALMVGAIAGTLRDMTDRLGREIQQRSGVDVQPAPYEVDLAEVVQSFPAAVMVVGPDTTLLYTSQPIAGIAPEAVRGVNVLNFVPRQHQELFMNALDRVFRTAQPSGYQVADTTGDPTLHIIRLAPVMKEGRVVSAVLLSLDVSDEQE
jgi:hypothetical protein